MTMRSGLWDDPEVWDSGCVPAPGDFAVVRHRIESREAVIFGAGGFLYIDPGAQLCAADSVIATCGSRFENHGTLATPVLRVRDGLNAGRLFLEAELEAEPCNYEFELGGEVDYIRDYCAHRTARLEDHHNHHGPLTPALAIPMNPDRLRVGN